MLYDTFHFSPKSLSLRRKQKDHQFQIKMKLIADSGSTKTSWKLIDGSGRVKDI